jgi:hypothetical protein
MIKRRLTKSNETTEFQNIIVIIYTYKKEKKKKRRRYYIYHERHGNDRVISSLSREKMEFIVCMVQPLVKDIK